MGRKLRFVAALSALLAVSTPLSAQDEPGADAHHEGTWHFGGVTFPSAVDTFRVMRTTRWPDARLGVSLTYLAAGLPAELSVYVYPAPGSTEDIVEQEFGTAMQGVEQFAASNRDGVTVEMEGRDAVEIDGDDGAMYPGWRGSAIMRRGSSARSSLLYVFQKDGWFLKYRISFERSMRDLMAERIDRFLAATLAEVQVP